MGFNSGFKGLTDLLHPSQGQTREIIPICYSV